MVPWKRVMKGSTGLCGTIAGEKSKGRLHSGLYSNGIRRISMYENGCRAETCLTIFSACDKKGDI
jgi:hypothetical protein